MKSLLDILQSKEDKQINLICFPFAGGGARAYYNWKRISKLASIYAISLPGRESKINEEPYRKMEILIDDLTEEISPLLNKKCIFFGHSMGAKIAFETAKKLEKMGSVQPYHLIVSGSRAPHIQELNPIYNLPDEEFIKALYRFEGTPKEILENKDLIRFFLPVLRADFTMDEIYYSKNNYPLKCPITALGGSKDREASLPEVEQWNEYTKNRFKMKIFKGGHFFIREQEEHVLEEIIRIIEQHKV
ncbi:MAG: thioesterase [Firmicutes bacterium]|nr:thioesterase [Bacillota bacterium]